MFNQADLDSWSRALGCLTLVVAAVLVGLGYVLGRIFH